MLTIRWCLPQRITSGRFSHVKEEHLDWKHRKKLLIQEMETLNADIMCFQVLTLNIYLIPKGNRKRCFPRRT